MSAAPRKKSGSSLVHPAVRALQMSERGMGPMPHGPSSPTSSSPTNNPSSPSTPTTPSSSLLPQIPSLQPTSQSPTLSSSNAPTFVFSTDAEAHDEKSDTLNPHDRSENDGGFGDESAQDTFDTKDVTNPSAVSATNEGGSFMPMQNSFHISSPSLRPTPIAPIAGLQRQGTLSIALKPGEFPMQALKSPNMSSMNLTSPNMLARGTSSGKMLTPQMARLANLPLMHGSFRMGSAHSLLDPVDMNNPFYSITNAQGLPDFAEHEVFSTGNPYAVFGLTPAQCFSPLFDKYPALERLVRRHASDFTLDEEHSHGNSHGAVDQNASFEDGNGADQNADGEAAQGTQSPAGHRNASSSTAAQQQQGSSTSSSKDADGKHQNSLANPPRPLKLWVDKKVINNLLKNPENADGADAKGKEQNGAEKKDQDPKGGKDGDKSKDKDAKSGSQKDGKAADIRKQVLSKGKGKDANAQSGSQSSRAASAPPKPDEPEKIDLAVSAPSLLNALKASKFSRTTEQVNEIIQHVKSFPCLSKLSTFLLGEICRVLTYSKFPINSTVFSQGDEGTTWYIILTGSVSVFITGGDGKEINVATIGRGLGFGELALLNDNPRAATIRTADVSEFLIVEKKDYQRILKLPHEREMQDRLSFLSSFCTFNLDRARLTELCGALSSKKVVANEVIVREASEADAVYIVQSGTCSIMKKLPPSFDSPKGRVVVLATLGPGDTFGDYEAVMRKQAFCGSLVANSNMRLLLVAKFDFSRFITDPDTIRAMRVRGETMYIADSKLEGVFHRQDDIRKWDTYKVFFSFSLTYLFL
eukprot:TRINITY_DN5140_c0_g1_i3.p1 TRINITY_DN5140_c0_g1~~TRINITY_DN5140_c0_g1_i3.p1  ORF type:complete len:811 (+),score=210.26 TRINITY_DN5140_c0_g1_i3:183-2615(+)